MKHKRFLTKIFFIFAVLAAISILFYIRMIPAMGHKVDFLYDKAFNYRMTLDVIQEGDVPIIDRLSTYPEGKNIKAFLPTGMYYTSALFFKFINFSAFLLKLINHNIGPVSLLHSALFFTALCGAMIFIPVYFISYEIYRNKAIAYVTAFLSGIMPAYLHRSTCYWYRFEAVATPLLFVSLLFFIKAFSATSTRKTFSYSALSAAFMVLSLWIWRLAVLFLLAYIIVFLYILFRKERVSGRRWLIFFIVLGASFLFLVLRPDFTGKTLFYNYWAFPRAGFQIIMDNMGIKQNFSDFTRLVYNNMELKRVPIVKMFGTAFFSFSGAFVIAYLFLYFRDKSRPAQKGIILVFLVFFLSLTFLFLRIKIILAPLVALVFGESMISILKRKKIWKYILLLLVAIALVKTTQDSYKLATTRYRYAKMDSYLRQAIDAVNEKTPEDAVILSYWADGYFVQTYCNRPTITDGLIESPEIVGRIMALSKIYYSSDENVLWNFCKKHEVAYMLVPANRKKSYAMYAGLEYRDYYREKKGTPKAKQTTLYKLIYEPDEVMKFKLLYKNKNYRLYEVI